MPVIAILDAEEVTDDENLAGYTRSTPGPNGGTVPTGCAGYTHDGAAYCPDCASEQTVVAPDGDGSIPMDHYPAFKTDPNGFGVGVLSRTDEWDYPGASCHVCHDRLQTRLLVYDDGGAHPPAAEMETDYGVVSVFVIETDGEDARTMLAEDYVPLGSAGDVSWCPKHRLIDYDE
jgi:hypothetical protein